MPICLWEKGTIPRASNRLVTMSKTKITHIRITWWIRSLSVFIAALSVLCLSGMAGEAGTVLSELQKRQRYGYRVGEGYDPMAVPVPGNQTLDQPALESLLRVPPEHQQGNAAEEDETFAEKIASPPETSRNPRVGVVENEETVSGPGDRENNAKRFSELGIHVDGVVFEDGVWTALINSRLYRVGEVLTFENDAVRVESVKSDGVVLVFHDVFFRVFAPKILLVENFIE